MKKYSIHTLFHATLMLFVVALIGLSAIHAPAQSATLISPPPVTEDSPILEHGVAVQIKTGYWLFQMKPRNDFHILIYIQEALDEKGERIGWATTQVAGEFGNSIDLMDRYVKGENFPNRKEFKETIELASLLEFMLAGKLDTSFWKGDFILISGDPDINLQKK